jgi:hypothetical protein
VYTLVKLSDKTRQDLLNILKGKFDFKDFVIQYVNFWWGHVANFFMFFFCMLSYYVSKRSLLWYPLWLPYKTMSGFVFISSCLQDVKGSCFIFTLFVFCFCFAFLRVVYPMLPFYLDFWLPLRCSFTFIYTI